jgi:hypothetical protein
MIQITIIETGKGYAPKDQWRTFNEETHIVIDMKAARAFLRARYGKAKRAAMYQDTKEGTKRVGYVFGFRNADVSHTPVEKWLQQDWVSFEEVKQVVLG